MRAPLPVSGLSMKSAWPWPAGDHSTRQWLRRSTMFSAVPRRMKEFSPVITGSCGSTRRGSAMSASHGDAKVGEVVRGLGRHLARPHLQQRFAVGGVAECVVHRVLQLEPALEAGRALGGEEAVLVVEALLLGARLEQRLVARGERRDALLQLDTRKQRVAVDVLGDAVGETGEARRVAEVDEALHRRVGAQRGELAARVLAGALGHQALEL